MTIDGWAGIAFAVSHVAALLGLGWLGGWYARGRAAPADPAPLRVAQGVPRGRHRDGAPPAPPAPPRQRPPLALPPPEPWPPSAPPPAPPAPRWAPPEPPEPETVTIELAQLRADDWAALAGGGDPAQQTLTLHLPARPAAVRHRTETTETTVITGPLPAVAGAGPPWGDAAPPPPEAEHVPGGSRRHPACWCREYHTRQEAEALTYFAGLNGGAR
jgi:hypothetical protein